MVLRESFLGVETRRRYIPQQVQRKRSIRRRKESGVERKRFFSSTTRKKGLWCAGGGYTSEALFRSLSSNLDNNRSSKSSGKRRVCAQMVIKPLDCCSTLEWHRFVVIVAAAAKKNLVIKIQCSVTFLSFFLSCLLYDESRIALLLYKTWILSKISRPMCHSSDLQYIFSTVMETWLMIGAMRESCRCIKGGRVLLLFALVVDA